MMPSPEPSTTPERCTLEHRMFSALGDLRFRRSGSDGTPMMAMSLGDREANIPIGSLCREFGIESTSPDGRMLDLIGKALDFVSVLQPGNRFPPEILTGEASWQPSPNHLRIAGTRLRVQLVAWLSLRAEPSSPLDSLGLLRLADDPQLHRDVQAVLGRAAMELGLPGPADVTRLLESLAEELGYIEALRERLLHRVDSVFRKLSRLHQQGTGHLGGTETLSQVKRLCGSAVKQTRLRFAELDGQTGEVLSLLRNHENQRLFIRSNRDWLYRSQRAWEPFLKQWEAAREQMDDGAWDLLARTYQFLAPRFMATTEWQSHRQHFRRSEAGPIRMTW